MKRLPPVNLGEVEASVDYRADEPVTEYDELPGEETQKEEEHRTVRQE